MTQIIKTVVFNVFISWGLSACGTMATNAAKFKNLDKLQDTLNPGECLPDFLYVVSRGICSYADTLDEERCAINSGTNVNHTEIQQLRFEARCVRRNRFRIFNAPRGILIRIYTIPLLR